jgi:uncharacterized protein (TIGR02246 family)
MASHDSVTELNDYFIETMNAGDLEGAVSCWTDDTVFHTADGPVTGMDNLREELQKFIDVKPFLTIEEVHRVEAGDTALVSLRWTLEGTSPDGEAMSMSATDANVFRRQADGTWRILIDNPFHSVHTGTDS